MPTHIYLSNSLLEVIYLNNKVFAKQYKKDKAKNDIFK